jgi:hypothetical protein
MKFEIDFIKKMIRMHSGINDDRLPELSKKRYQRHSGNRTVIFFNRAFVKIIRVKIPKETKFVTPLRRVINPTPLVCKYKLLESKEVPWPKR